MSQYLQHILEQHLNPGQAISPRLPGKYEQAGFSREDTPPVDDMIQTVRHTEAPLMRNDLHDRSRADLRSDQASGQNNMIRDRSFPGPESVIPSESNNPAQNNRRINFPAANQDTSNELIRPQAQAMQFDPAPRAPMESPGEHASRVHYTEPPAPAGQTGRYMEHDAVSPGDQSLPFDKNDQPRASVSGYLNANRTGIPENYFAQARPGREQTNNAPEMDAPETSNTVIRISIGRIDVQASAPPSPVKSATPPAPKPNLSLEDYLRKRNNS